MQIRPRLRSLPVLVFVAGAIFAPAAAAQSPSAIQNKTSTPIALERMDHVGIHVTNLESSAEFYKKLFDFDIVNKWNTTWMIGKGRIRLGLFLRPEAGSVADPDKAKIIEHVAFLTSKEELERYKNVLTALGIAHEEDDSGIAKSVFIKDPDGISIEVTNYYAKAPPRR